MLRENTDTLAGTLRSRLEIVGMPLGPDVYSLIIMMMMGHHEMGHCSLFLIYVNDVPVARSETAINDQEY